MARKSSKPMFSSWPDSALVAGRKEGFVEGFGLVHAGGYWDTADLAVALVVDPAGAGDVAAGDALGVDAIGLVDEHGAAAEGVAVGGDLGTHLVDVGGNEVVGHDVGGQPKPVLRHAREHSPLAWDRVREDVVEGRDAIGGDDQQPVVQVVNVADFAAIEQGEP